MSKVGGIHLFLQETSFPQDSEDCVSSLHPEILSPEGREPRLQNLFPISWILLFFSSFLNKRHRRANPRKVSLQGGNSSRN